MRSTAFKDADLIIVLGTRMVYIISDAAPLGASMAAKIACIDIDAQEIATAARKVDIGIVGDCRSVLNQVLAVEAGSIRLLQGAAQDASTAWPRSREPGANKMVEDGDIDPARGRAREIRFMSATRLWSTAAG